MNFSLPAGRRGCHIHPSTRKYRVTYYGVSLQPLAQDTDGLWKSFLGDFSEQHNAVNGKVLLKNHPQSTRPEHFLLLNYSLH